MVLDNGSVLRPDVFGSGEGDDMLGELFLDTLDEHV